MFQIFPDLRLRCSIFRSMKSTVVIADDDSTIRELVADILKQHSFEVVQASSGEQALDLVHGRKIDAFLLDISMSQMSGIELCRAIRSLDGHKTTPIIF